jgi:hypothetical protein
VLGQWLNVGELKLVLFPCCVFLRRRPMRLGGGLGGDSRLPKEPRKKILAEAAARGVAAPPAADDRPVRYSIQRFGGVRQLCQQALLPEPTAGLLEEVASWWCGSGAQLALFVAVGQLCPNTCGSFGSKRAVTWGRACSTGAAGQHACTKDRLGQLPGLISCIGAQQHKHGRLVQPAIAYMPFMGEAHVS